MPAFSASVQRWARRSARRRGGVGARDPVAGDDLHLDAAAAAGEGGLEIEERGGESVLRQVGGEGDRGTGELDAQAIRADPDCGDQRGGRGNAVPGNPAGQIGDPGGRSRGVGGLGGVEHRVPGRLVARCRATAAATAPSRARGQAPAARIVWLGVSRSPVASRSLPLSGAASSTGWPGARRGFGRWPPAGRPEPAPTAPRR